MTPFPNGNVVVGASRYTVSDSKAEHKKSVRDDQIKAQQASDVPAFELYGYSDHINRRISVNPDMSEGKKQETLLHELAHVLWRFTNWNTPGDLSEEDIVRRIAPPLLDLIQRNPAVVAYLQDMSA